MVRTATPDRFSEEQPERLSAALHALAGAGEVIEVVSSAHGKEYVVEGWLAAQTEETRQRLVRSVWIIDRGSDVPRLVTAYPGRE